MMCRRRRIIRGPPFIELKMKTRSDIDQNRKNFGEIVRKDGCQKRLFAWELTPEPKVRKQQRKKTQQNIFEPY